MYIKDLYKQKKTVISTELFPPRKTKQLNNLDGIIEEISDLGVDFISITYGALQSKASHRSVEISKLIKSKGVEPLIHFTAHSMTKEKITHYIDELSTFNIKNVLALRGDQLNDDSEFEYASDLIEYIQDKDLCIGAACYPEKHLEALSLDADMDYLKQKVDCGVDFLVTQLFYDNKDFYYFRDECKKRGINVPISCGIMPVTNKRQIDKITSISGAKIPLELRMIMDKFKDNPKALEEAGIAYAVNQIIDLIVHDVQGVHLYIMNKPSIYRKILKGIKHILGFIDDENNNS